MSVTYDLVVWPLDPEEEEEQEEEEEIRGKVSGGEDEKEGFRRRR